jgi:hypothetical protein
MFATKFATSNNKTCDLGSAQKFLGILSAKCPVFMGLLRIDYAKLFLYDPLDNLASSHKLEQINSVTGYSSNITKDALGNWRFFIKQERKCL